MDVFEFMTKLNWFAQSVALVCVFIPIIMIVSTLTDWIDYKLRK